MLFVLAGSAVAAKPVAGTEYVGLIESFPFEMKVLLGVDKTGAKARFTYLCGTGRPPTVVFGVPIDATGHFKFTKATGSMVVWKMAGQLVYADQGQDLVELDCLRRLEGLHEPGAQVMGRVALPYAHVTDIPASWETYRQVSARRRPADAGPDPPRGGPDGRGLRIIEVWESEEAWRRFRDGPLADARREQAAHGVEVVPTVRELGVEHLLRA